MRELLPETWPLASALVLARKEALDPAVREAFAVAGIAHLLAISGFHVGVVAVLVGVAVRGLGASPRRAPAYAASVTWLYIGLIGFPDAATRAALILTFVAAGRLRARPAGAFGAIASAGILLFVLDPSALGRPGFQLSFAGAFGLLILRPAISGYLNAPAFNALPGVLKDATAAGIGATLATMPFVAFHFGRISIVGVLATLVATPLVSAAIPGLLSAVGSSWVFPPLARFLAGGTDILLRVLESFARLCASVPWASLWIGDAAMIGGVLGAVGASIGVRFVGAGLGRGVRWITIGVWALFGAGVAPLADRWIGMGTMEIVFIDVGQGDAVAIRSPKGRWILVDTGPASLTYDAGRRVVLPYLRRRGVARIESLVLTHPDLDHIGGAESIVSDLDVGYVLDPSEPTGRDAYVGVLEAASRNGIPWLKAGREISIRLDGVEVSVLHPGGPTPDSYRGTDSNAQSVVLLVRYGEFEALLTGDAPVEVEEAVLDDLPSQLEVLKVVSRIIESGSRVLRTDVNGDIVIRARRSGLYEVRTEW
jgi:competence protein ComEC